MITSVLISLLKVILQYGILIFLFYFLWKMGKSLAPALKMPAHDKESSVGGPGEAVLTFVEGPDEYKGRRFAFSDSLSVGRAEDNDLVISDSFISHHHIIFQRVQTLYTVQDLGSANHTFVNEELLEERRILKNGDRIRLGTITILFER